MIRCCCCCHRQLSRQCSRTFRPFLPSFALRTTTPQTPRQYDGEKKISANTMANKKSPLRHWRCPGHGPLRSGLSRPFHSVGRPDAFVPADGICLRAVSRVPQPHAQVPAGDRRMSQPFVLWMNPRQT